ncbi:CBS domain-containing protein [Mariprofundus sp. EBB-1]|uniref:CBS domain-containing protein n=1 Tax=Mariprofundus sp. EBB-1 TaxID=2650971 RepID=UPI000EF221FB|nr:CBS domain-containing protein [Mariprofundus sp. EBB-1]RLL51323.1 CBS domain-containing protein [Mariprofundus sp. EBB-1]
MAYSKVFARDIMNASPPHCHMDLSVEAVAKRFADEDITGMLVVDDDKRLLGVITESNLVDQQRNLHLPTAIALFDMVIPMGAAKFEQELKQMQAMTVGDLVEDDVVSVKDSADLNEVSSIMSDHRINHLPVLDESGDVVVGMICKHDVIKALVAH